MPSGERWDLFTSELFGAHACLVVNITESVDNPQLQSADCSLSSISTVCETHIGIVIALRINYNGKVYH